jgi:hypothetical protein
MPAIGYVSNIIRAMYLFFAGYLPLLIAIVYTNAIHIAYVEDDLFVSFWRTSQLYILVLMKLSGTAQNK